MFLQLNVYCSCTVDNDSLNSMSLATFIFLDLNFYHDYPVCITENLAKRRFFLPYPGHCDAVICFIAIVLANTK